MEKGNNAISKKILEYMEENSVLFWEILCKEFHFSKLCDEYLEYKPLKDNINISTTGLWIVNAVYDSERSLREEIDDRYPDVDNEQSTKENSTLELPIMLRIEAVDNVPHPPLRATIIRIGKTETNIVLPLVFTSIESRIDYAKKELEQYNLSEKALKSLQEFMMFKCQTNDMAQLHPEGLETYYNLLLYGDDMNSIHAVYDAIRRAMGISERNSLEDSEINLFSLMNLDRPNTWKRMLDDAFGKREYIFIYECGKKPYVNTDAGTGSELERQKKILDRYNFFWNYVSQLAKKDKKRTVILGMRKTVYTFSFSANNELNHRVFGHRMEVSTLEMRYVIDYCMDKLGKSTVKRTKDFDNAFIKYIERIYSIADLKGLEFADDAINRVYSYYFRKRRKNNELMGVDCIPPYDEKIRSAKDILATFDNLIGLQDVRKELEKIYIQNIMDPVVSQEKLHHMMFLGNPGTGKTTVSKLMADFFCRAGILKTNRCIEVRATDLLSMFRSGAPEKTLDAIERATDGVLFIDEAYELGDTENYQNSEVWNVLLTEMVKRKDHLVVILAGYEAQMMDLLKVNPGISGRVPYKIHFNDFTDEELAEIFRNKLKSWEFKLSPNAEETLMACIRAKKVEEYFANARTMEDLASEVHKNWCEDSYASLDECENQNKSPKKIITKKHFAGLLPNKKNPQIEDLVGLESVKNQLREFERTVQYQHALKEQGFIDTSDSYMHMFFRGNPGTGKTMVAKLIADDLYSMGVLKTNHLVVVELQDLTGSKVGEPSKKAKEFVRKAVGGVLFFDEAYALAEEKNVGKEIVDVFLTGMVDHREDTVFIFAGYPQNMSELLKLNPGFRSRIGYFFDFDDYNADELLQIFDKKIKDAGFKVSKAARTRVGDLLEYFCEIPDFGNGRFVDKLITKCLAKRARRSFEKNTNRLDACDIPEVEELQEMSEGGKYLLNPAEVTKEMKRITAYHELGHAIVFYELEKKNQLLKISIKGHAHSFGRVSLKPSSQNKTRTELINDIAISLAGRCAEMIFFGDYDTGCASDYEAAKKTATDMKDKYGMCSENETLQSLLNQGEEKAKDVINKHKHCMEILAEELLNGAEFTGEEFYKRVKEIEAD